MPGDVYPGGTFPGGSSGPVVSLPASRGAVTAKERLGLPDLSLLAGVSVVSEPKAGTIVVTAGAIIKLPSGRFNSFLYNEKVYNAGGVGVLQPPGKVSVSEPKLGVVVVGG